MRYTMLACLIALIVAATTAPGCGRKPKLGSSAATSTAHALSAAPTSGDRAGGGGGASGVYGFSGARVAESAPEGVIGECLWVFDEGNQHQVAKGECSAAEPGKFRVALQPGKYVVRGPGGNQPIEIKPGRWIEITSLAELPLAP
jgi:hypothetical protein